PGLPAAAGNGLAGVRLGGTAAPPGQQLRSPAADGAAAAGLAAARAGRCALVAAAPAGADRRLAARASERRQRSPCRDVGPIIAAMLKDPFQRLGLDREVLSVSQLNGRARALLEDVFAQVWVEGEISNLSRPTSGHVYFTLKDAKAQVRCALFRQQAARVREVLRDGLLVRVRGRVSLYE